MVMAPHISNSVTGLLNIATLLVALWVVGGAAWIHVHRSGAGAGACQRDAAFAAAGIGAAAAAVAVAGIVGSWCRVRWLLWLYLLCVLLLMVALAAFALFALLVTQRGAAQLLSNGGIQQYRLGNYSSWLQSRVERAATWSKIRACIHDSRICPALNQQLTETLSSSEQFGNATLNPIQSGCCLPPVDCNLEYVSGSGWNNDGSGGGGGGGGVAATADPDCARWSNRENVLCYNCDSCRAGVVNIVRNNWRTIAMFNGVSLLVLMTLYSIACCARRNNARDRKYTSI